MLNKQYTIEEPVVGLNNPISLRELLEKSWLLPKK